jgi:murein DD-endopeptidase MepM/ murein hydrolase activator NlpD
MRKRSAVQLLIILLTVAVWCAPAAAESGGPLRPAFHVVQRGETLLSIARRYGTTVDAITHANGIADPRRVYVGQQLLVPGELGPVESWSAHIVQAGETLTAIAARYGMSPRSLALSNRIVNPHLLHAGQVLQLPDPLERLGLLHAMQPGETLLQVAVRHGVPYWELVDTNGITSPGLVPAGRWVLITGEQPASVPAPFVAVDFTPVPVEQGQTLFITVRTLGRMTLEGSLFDRPLSFFPDDDVYRAVVGVHTFVDPGLYEMTLTAVDGGGQRVTVTVGVVVAARRHNFERIDVPPSRSSLLDPALVAEEQVKIEALRATVTPGRRWQGPFLQPVNGAISSYFGTRRSYNGSPYTSYHSGVDFNVGRGTLVRAAADGVVVMAEQLAVRGNVVVIDHGAGVLTGYWHLFSMEVVPGQEVGAGDVIARVGNTGLSTGSHLHWELWVGGVSVDALQWLDSAYPWGATGGGGTPP